MTRLTIDGRDDDQSFLADARRSWEHRRCAPPDRATWPLDEQRGQFDEVLCSIHASRARKDAINPVAIGAAFRFRRCLYAHMKH